MEDLPIDSHHLKVLASSDVPSVGLLSAAALPDAYEHQLSEQLRTKLARTDDESVLGLSKLAVLHYELAGLGNVDLHPKAFNFLHAELADRAPGILRWSSQLLVTYFTERDDAESRQTAADLGSEIAGVLHLGATALVDVEIRHRASALTRPDHLASVD